MARKIKAVIYGAGMMGCVAARLMLDKGVEIVGAIARSPEKVGRDLGELGDLGYPLGIIVESDAAAVLARTKPDIVLLCTSSFMVQVMEQLRVCITAGANIVTIAEEPLYPWSSSPELTKEIDALAKQHGVTVTGSGHQDGFFLHLPLALAGAAHRIDTIIGRASWNADDYGADVIRSKHVGSTLEEFNAWAADANRPPNYGRNILGAMAAALKLTPLRWHSDVNAIVTETDRPSRSLGTTLEAGMVVGYSDVDTLETREGTTFRFEMAGYVYPPGQQDYNEWTIKGEPDLFLSNGVVPTAMSTCTHFVNRIPDVINAEPGFVTVDAMGPAPYLAHPMETYVAPDKLGRKLIKPVEG